MNIDKEDSVYYVKYSAWSADYNGLLERVSLRNEKGKIKVFDFTDERKSRFEIIIGPVSCGFECRIATIGYMPGSRIECSKNNSPFAYKASGGKDLRYTIDY